MRTTRPRDSVVIAIRRGGSRWTRWARALRGGRTRAVARWRGLALTLARRRAALHVHVGRLLRGAATTMHPRFNVNVRFTFASLGGTPRSEGPPPSRLAPPSRVARAAAMDHRGALAARVRDAFALRTPFSSGRPPMGRATSGPAVLVLARHGHASAVVGRHDVVRLHDAPAAPSLAIIRRVVEERRRVEHGMPLALVTQHQTAPPTRAGAGDVTRVSPRGARVGAPAMAQPPPTIDIERLTDQVVRQINHGIIAQRERMGRLS